MSDTTNEPDLDEEVTVQVTVKRHHLVYDRLDGELIGLSDGFSNSYHDNIKVIE